MLCTFSDKTINKSKTIAAAVDSLWWKWTSHQGLLLFFGIDNKIELTPGGAFEIYFLMDNPPGLRGSEGCKVLSFVPKQMFSFTWNAPPQFAEIRNSSHQTWVVINFKKITDNHTEIHLQHLGWPKDNEWTPVYEYFDTAWDIVLNRLQESYTIV